MILDPVRNKAIVQLSAGYAAGVTTVVLVGGDGAKLPAPATEGAFNLAWWNLTDYTNPADDPNYEIVRCTARSTDTLTIVRAQEDTADVNHNISGKTYKMILAPTKKLRDDIETALNVGLNPTLNSVFFEDFNCAMQDATTFIVYAENIWGATGFAGLFATSAQDRNGVVLLIGETNNRPCLCPYGSDVMLPYVQSKNPIVVVREAQFGTATGVRYFGLADTILYGAPTVPTNGIYFRHANAGNYIGVCRKASSESTVDTGVAAANGVFHTLKFVVTGTTKVEFFVDGVSKGSITNAAYIPTVNMYFSIGSDAKNEAVGFYLDCVHILQTR